MSVLNSVVLDSVGSEDTSLADVRQDQEGCRAHERCHRCFDYRRRDDATDRRGKFRTEGCVMFVNLNPTVLACHGVAFRWYR